MSDQAGFEEWLKEAVGQIGAHSAAVLRMDNPRLRELHLRERQHAAEWLKAGLHGEMHYLERMFEQKYDPWNSFPFAKSVIVLTFTNHWGDPMARHPFPEPAPGALVGYISAYAREIDYHRTGQRMLSELLGRLGEGVHGEATVDTKAVDERLFALAGGLGVMGANTLLRVPGRTNVRVFVGCLFVDVELPEVIVEPKMPFLCRDCQSCIKNCPTGAIRENLPMDARKCISYITIEKNDVLSQEDGALMGDWLFGCDDCTTVCPPRDKVDTRIPVDLEWLLKSSAGEVRRRIRESAVAYAGVTKLRRNAVVLLKKNSSPQARELLGWVGANTGSTLVKRQAAAW